MATNEESVGIYTEEVVDYIHTALQLSDNASKLSKRAIALVLAYEMDFLSHKGIMDSGVFTYALEEVEDLYPDTETK